MILFEMTAIAYADGTFNTEEEKLMNSICDKWQLDISILPKMGEQIDKLRVLYSAIGEVIGGE